MILLSRVEPTANLNRWYLVSVQATLFDPCAVIVAWGRRDNEFQRWRTISVDTPEKASQLAEKIVKRKIQRGYHISVSART